MATFHSTGQVPDAHARTDRQPAGRSVRSSPESLYLWQIAVLQAQVDALRHDVERRERTLQRVRDRYEHLLDERTRDGELLTDGGPPPQSRDSCPVCRLRDRVRGRR